tara:strand:+ start:758 stop:1066 length:309 start_codon:yes stop_codon:yes gene_type:complete
MIYRIYDRLNEWHGLQNPASDNWATVKTALTSIAKDAGFSKPTFDAFGHIGLHVRFESTSDQWRLTYDEGDEFALTIREHCEINNQDFEESFVFNFEKTLKD